MVKIRNISILVMVFLLTSCSSFLDQNKQRRTPQTLFSECLTRVNNLFSGGIHRQINEIVESEKSRSRMRYELLYFIREEYKGEELGKAKRHHVKGQKVLYFNERQRHASRVFFLNKGIVQDDQYMYCNRCEYLTVVDELGRMYVTQGETGRVHHSSFLSGKGVAAAGTILMEGDQITAISNISGHYAPDENALFVILDSILRGGQNPPKRLLYVRSDGFTRTYHFDEIIARYYAGNAHFEMDLDRRVTQGVLRVAKEHGLLR